MTARKHTPAHDFWHPRVEGQLRDAMHSHPEWFAKLSPRQRRACINGIAKRIVGEIVACDPRAPRAAGDGPPLCPAEAAGCDSILRQHDGGVAPVCPAVTRQPNGGAHD